MRRGSWASSYPLVASLATPVIQGLPGFHLLPLDYQDPHYLSTIWAPLLSWCAPGVGVSTGRACCPKAAPHLAASAPDLPTLVEPNPALTSPHPGTAGPDPAYLLSPSAHWVLLQRPALSHLCDHTRQPRPHQTPGRTLSDPRRELRNLLLAVQDSAKLPTGASICRGKTQTRPPRSLSRLARGASPAISTPSGADQAPASRGSRGQAVTAPPGWVRVPGRPRPPSGLDRGHLPGVARVSSAARLLRAANLDRPRSEPARIAQAGEGVQWLH